MQRFTVIGRFPALNDIVAAAKQHWSAYSKEKAERTTYVAIMARAAKLTPITGRCMVRCLWYEKDKRRDPDNVRVGIKFILDGLVQAGILPTDGWKCITGLEDRFYVDKERPRVEIEIVEVP
jgi:Holliday junction resolvase RusA-like endonuclease|tara:strand:+ start:702 stop:1067 length:366 start_codon:yes stop_codon:yes gene_type:complete